VTDIWSCILRIQIPFRPHFKEAIIGGRKTATSRTTKYGNPGDQFEAFGHVFVIDRHERVKLSVVAREHFRAEGFEHPDEFKIEWADIHPSKGYDPNQRIWLHWFQRKVPRHQPHFTPTEKQMELDRDWMTLSDEKSGESCQCERIGLSSCKPSV